MFSAVVIDDVLAYTGNATSFSLSSLNASLPHYFRLAYRELIVFSYLRGRN